MEVSMECMKSVFELGISQERPIMMDYWVESTQGRVFIGIKEGEKILVKNEEEYTSPIKNIYESKSKQEYIILTENSIYVVSHNIKAKNIK
jgi:hypothetical protein